MKILLEFNPKTASKKDIEEIKDILELLQSKYNFRWNVQGGE